MKIGLRLAKVIVKNILSRFLWFTVYIYILYKLRMSTCIKDTD